MLPDLEKWSSPVSIGILNEKLVLHDLKRLRVDGERHTEKDKVVAACRTGRDCAGVAENQGLSG